MGRLHRSRHRHLRVGSGLIVTVTVKAFQTPYHGGRVIVVPSWRAAVPSVVADATAHGALTEYFSASRMDLPRAERQARSVVQMTFQRAYLEGLKRCVARRAVEYAEGWPALIGAAEGVRNGISLCGFRPERVSSMYVPFQNTGRAGLLFARRMLAEMAQAAKEMPR